jgi:hypothetical protein
MKAELTAAQEKFLREQVIDDQHPGPILHDFRMLLDFVGSEGVPAAGKYNLLPIDRLDELDQRLSRPLHLTLQRPQLKSHQYLRGLHLLFRATGLARVEGTGAKTRLVVDAPTRERWDALNPTEQYFTLLEAWLRVGRGEMVGERGSRFDYEAFSDCLQAWRYLPPAGLTFDVSHPERVHVPGLYGGNYHVGLMDLFGLWKIVHAPVAPAPWIPAGLEHTPFGDAVFTIFERSFEDILFNRVVKDDEEAMAWPVFGLWQPLFQPYFPAWRNNLVVGGEEEVRAGVFVFKVSLGKIWRRIALESDATMTALADWILRSVHFDDDHLYQFSYRDRFGTTVAINHEYMDEPPWTTEVTLGELPLEPGQSMTFWYDFGDDWMFDVKLERIEPPTTRIKAPRIMATHGRAPEQYPRYED